MRNYKKFQYKKHERKIFLKKKKKNIGFQRAGTRCITVPDSLIAQGDIGNNAAKIQLILCCV